MPSDNQEDEFTEISRKRKKRKATGSPTLPTLQKTGSSELPPGTPTRPKPAIIKNKILVVLSGINAEHKNWRKLLSELRQFHPGLKVSQIKELPKGDVLIIGDSMQDVLILQSENKMNAALGQNVKVSLPKAFQTNKQQTKTLAVKGVPSDISDSEFKEFLGLNKINFAKAERLKSKKDGRVLPIFRLEISDLTEAEALISQNLVCNVTGIVYKVEEFRTPILVMQCFNCQCFGHSAKTFRSKQKFLICGGNHSHTGCPSKESRKPTFANCKGPHVASYKGCPGYKKQAFRQHVVNNQNTYTSVVSQNTLQQFQTSQTFNFAVEQLTKFVANVVIQIAQPQVCYPSPKQDTLDLKSSMCRKVSNTAKNILGVDITGKDLFESIGSLKDPATPPPLNPSNSRVPKWTRPPKPPQNHLSP